MPPPKKTVDAGPSVGAHRRPPRAPSPQRRVDVPGGRRAAQLAGRVRVEVAVAAPHRAERNVNVDAEVACRARPLASTLLTAATPRYFFLPLSEPSSEVLSAAMNASGGTSTEPMFFMRFLPAFCFSSSLRLREMSPP